MLVRSTHKDVFCGDATVQFVLSAVVLGWGFVCLSRMITIYAHLYGNTSTEWRFCVCFGLCPNSTDDEIEAIFERVVNEKPYVWTTFNEWIVGVYSVIMAFGVVGKTTVVNRLLFKTE